MEILSRCVKAISIHAPPRRSATPPRLSQNSIEVLFQSTHPREGVRPYDIQLYMMYSFISIHAPPRRSATPAKECDLRFNHVDFGEIQFQSTHPREGVRRSGFHLPNTDLSFQSTHPREGVRLDLAPLTSLA